MRHVFALDGTDRSAWLGRCRDGYRLEVGGRSEAAALEPLGEDRYELRVGQETRTVELVTDGDVTHIHMDGVAHVVRYRDPVEYFAAEGAEASQEIARAPMPGIVVKLIVAPGQSVAAGDGLIVIESMKLETTIRAWRDGEVEAVHVAPGGAFDRDAPLVSLAPVGGA